MAYSQLIIMVLGLLLLVQISHSAFTGARYESTGAHYEATGATLTIFGGTYGPSDVTSTLRTLVRRDQSLVVKASNSVFGDTWKGVAKTLVVVYQQAGYQPTTLIAREGQTLTIPSRPVVPVQLSLFTCYTYPLRIVGAAYGLAEVTGKVRSLVEDGGLDVYATNSVFRDTFKGEGKTLVVVYQQRNGPYRTRFAKEGNRLHI